MTDIYEPTREEIFERMIARMGRSYNAYVNPSYIGMTCLVELVKFEKASFLFLKDENIKNWYENEYALAKKELVNYRKNMDIYKAKAQVYLKLTEEERKVLRLTKPKKPTLRNG